MEHSRTKTFFSRLWERIPEAASADDLMRLFEQTLASMCHSTPADDGTQRQPDNGTSAVQRILESVLSTTHINDETLLDDLVRAGRLTLRTRNLLFRGILNPRRYHYALKKIPCLLTLGQVFALYDAKGEAYFLELHGFGETAMAELTGLRSLIGTALALPKPKTEKAPHESGYVDPKTLDTMRLANWQTKFDPHDLVRENLSEICTKLEIRHFLFVGFQRFLRPIRLALRTQSVWDEMEQITLRDIAQCSETEFLERVGDKRALLAVRNFLAEFGLAFRAEEP